MKPILVSDLKVKFLGVTPVFQEGNTALNPQQIVSLSALLTFKGKSIKRLFKEIRNKEGDINERIKKILQNSSLRGHSSIATTPTLCLAFEGSKFLDSALTGIIFSSSLMASGRRTDTTEKDIVFPLKIFRNRKAKQVYANISKKIIADYNELLKKGASKDEASKILQYGIYGTGIIYLPIESLVGVKREYEKEKDWMPTEIGLLLRKIEKNLKRFGLDWLYATRYAAPRNIYPYPNIFKDPTKTNIVRELRRQFREETKMLSVDILESKGLKEKLNDLRITKGKSFSSLRGIKKNWFNILNQYQEILRDYNTAFNCKVLSTVPWRVWGEKKRHRTVPMIVESIYFCIERAAKTFKKFQREIQNISKKNKKTITQNIERVFSIPPSIKNNNEFLQRYLSTALESFKGYQKLIKIGIQPCDAIFLIPRGVKIDVLQSYDLYNLLAGYYPLRLCTTAEEEMRRNTLKEISQLRKITEERKCGWLNKHIVPKCEMVGFCPEEKSCGQIHNLVKKYNDSFHRTMKDELKKRFQENLKNLGKGTTPF